MKMLLSKKLHKKKIKGYQAAATAVANPFVRKKVKTLKLWPNLYQQVIALHLCVSSPSSNPGVSAYRIHQG